MTALLSQYFYILIILSPRLIAGDDHPKVHVDSWKVATKHPYSQLRDDHNNCLANSQGHRGNCSKEQLGHIFWRDMLFNSRDTTPNHGYN